MTKAAFAIVFPGQGSQSVGMLSALAAEHAIIGDTFAEASDLVDRDLWALAQNGPEELLSQTEITQPLMYTSGVALWRLWSQMTEGRAPVAVAGHSLGEFCALTASGVMTFAEGIQLVNTRAQLMASAVPDGEGGMAAILGMDDDAVIAVCEQVSEQVSNGRVVQAVNFNSPGQVAVSGHVDALEQVCTLAREQGARKAVMLPVSVPNHSSLMREAGQTLAGHIDRLDLQAPQFPVIQNRYARVAADQADLISSLKEHVYSPVQWTASYRVLLEQFEPSAVIELGPGKVLAGLGKRIERSLPVNIVDSPESLGLALTAISEET